MLQLLDDGRLTDGQGRTVDFRNTVVIMTSNIRSPEALQEQFRPEFLNRIDEIVVFEPLTREQLTEIVELQLGRLRERLAERRIELELTDEAKEHLAEAGWDPAYGARPLKRAIQRMLENPLALELLEGRFSEGDAVRVDAAGRRARLRARRGGRAGGRVASRPVERATKPYRKSWWRRGLNALVRPLARLGLTGPRTHLLTVPGRRTGKPWSTPVSIVEDDGERWLVAPYGDRNWVKNARAAGWVELRRRVAASSVWPSRSSRRRTPFPCSGATTQLGRVTRPFFDVQPRVERRGVARRGPTPSGLPLGREESVRL